GGEAEGRDGERGRGFSRAGAFSLSVVDRALGLVLFLLVLVVVLQRVVRLVQAIVLGHPVLAHGSPVTAPAWRDTEPWSARRMAKVAIVTGSDSGIGKATAVALARDGFDIGITWHEDEEGAQSTAREVEEHERRAEVRRLDLAGLPAAADVIDELVEALGGV